MTPEYEELAKRLDKWARITQAETDGVLAADTLFGEAATAIRSLVEERDARGQEAFTMRTERDSFKRDRDNWLRLHDQQEERAETAEAELARVREGLDDGLYQDDEALVDAFHAELKRQGAFSIERHGKVALGMAPFMEIAFIAIRRKLAEPQP